MSSIDPALPAAPARATAAASSRRRALLFSTGTALLAGLFAAWSWLGWGRPGLSLGSLAFAGMLLATAALHPPAVLAVRAGWLRAARAVGAVNTAIILTVVYFVLLVPVAIAQRLFGRDPLSRRDAPRFVSRRDKRDRSHFERPY